MAAQLKQHEVLARASSFLKRYNREANIADILLRHHLNVSRTAFYAMMREPVPAAVLEAFTNDIEKHAETGIPVQHLTGYTSFYGRCFTVNRDVLIPRQQTEELVQHAIRTVQKCAGKHRSFTIVDAGTGSGVIAITLALELSRMNVYATDISQAALAVARKNARRLQADVTFVEGDFLQPMIEENIHPHLLIANPPYIPSAEAAALSDTVRHFDPALALFAGEDGLVAYRTILAQMKKLPAPEAVLFEIGHDQGQAVRTLIKQTYPASDPAIYRDINGRERVVSAFL